MLEPRNCLACSNPINPLPPVSADAFNEPYPPKEWEVVCPSCGSTNIILRNELPEELVRELEESRAGWDGSEYQLSESSAEEPDNPNVRESLDALEPLDLDDLFGASDEQSAIPLTPVKDESFDSTGADVESASDDEYEILDELADSVDATEPPESVLSNENTEENLADLLSDSSIDLSPENVDDPRDGIREASVEHSGEDLSLHPLSYDPDELGLDDSPTNSESGRSTESDTADTPNSPKSDEQSSETDDYLMDLLQGTEASGNPSLPSDPDLVDSMESNDTTSFQATWRDDSESDAERQNQQSIGSEELESWVSDEDPQNPTRSETVGEENTGIESWNSDEIGSEPDNDRNTEVEEGFVVDELEAASSDVSEQDIEPEPGLAAGGWDDKKNQGLLKPKKEKSLVRRVLPPLLGAAAALPIALAILWYGFGTDLGGIGPIVAQYVPAVVPENLRGNSFKATPYRPPVASNPTPDVSSESDEPMDITDLGRSEDAAALQPSEAVTLDEGTVGDDPLSTNIADSNAFIEDSDADAEESLETPQASFDASWEPMLNRLGSSVSDVSIALDDFFTIGAIESTKRPALAKQFWATTQALGDDVEQLVNSSATPDPNSNQQLAALALESIVPWTDSALANANATKLIQRCADTFRDLGAPKVLYEVVDLDLSTDAILTTTQKYQGIPITIEIPTTAWKKLNPNGLGGIPSLLFGTIENADEANRTENIFRVHLIVQ